MTNNTLEIFYIFREGYSKTSEAFAYTTEYNYKSTDQIKKLKGQSFFMKKNLTP